MALNDVPPLPPFDPESPRNGNISKLRKDDLKERLMEAGIKFDDGLRVPELQAVCALYQQGIIGRGDTPDSNLVQVVSQWIKLSVSALIKLLNEKKLDTSGHKWDHIEILIRAQ
jgi:hypothetical protein